MRKPAVAILHYTAPPVIGGVEAVIQSHSKVFLEHDFPVTVIAGRGEADALPEGASLVLVPEIDSQNEQILSLNDQLERGELPDGFERITEYFISRLVPILERFDVVMIHNILSKHFNLPLTAALDRMIVDGTIKYPISWTHDISWTSPHSRTKVFPGFPWDLLRTYRPEISYVAVSQERQASLAGLFGITPQKIHIIYNGVDAELLLGLTAEAARLIRRLDLLESDLNLLMPVRVTRAKNIEYALRVLKVLVSTNRNAKMVLTGPPDPHEPDSLAYFESLKKLRGELGLEQNFHFVFDSGPNPEQPYQIDLRVVGDLYRMSDILFMPSLREGFGMPVLEAGLAGIHVVATDIPAVREIGEQDVMLIRADGSPEEVAGRILAWADSDHEHRLKVKVRKNYTWEAIFRQKIEPLLIPMGT